MKRTLAIILAMAAFAACDPDEIEIVSGGESGGSSSSTSLVDPALKWNVSSYEATLGGENTFPTLTNSYGVDVSYSSSSADVATVSSNGTVTLVSAGTATITASSEEDDTFEASSASYTLTVVKSSDGISWSAEECTVTIGASDNTFPTLSNPGNQEVTYSSGNTSVASIDSESGEITLVAEGSTSIIATSVENDSYDAASVLYTLIVQAEESNLEDPGISWSESSFTATLASSNTFPTLSNPNGVSVSYSSSDETVATVDSEGNVTMVSAGTVAISATSEKTDTYSSASASYILKIVKHDLTLTWSDNSCTASLEGGNTFPTLSVDPSDAGITVSYSSSNTSVATVDQNGNVTLVSTGSTTISATFDGDDTYKAASASYTLAVTSGEDDGAGTWSFSSTGDTSSEDDISLTTFTRMITITYGSSSASVTGDYYGYVSVSGNDVTVNNTGNDENIIYKLTGSSSDGFFKLYSSKKQAIMLSGLSLTNPDGAAINVQSGKRTFVVVEGTNTVSDGTSAAYSASGSEDMKAVIFSEGQLIFSGSGSLSVIAQNKQSKSGIVSDDYVRMMKSPTVKVTAGSSAGHGLRGKEYVRISDGTLDVSTSAAMKKGVGSDDYVLVEGGTSTITVSGGVAYDSEDSEYKGSAGIKADNYFAMTGGTVTIKNTGAGGKGISAGSYDYDETSHTLSDSYISGGSLTITTTGSESNDVSSKGIKIGYKEGSGRSYVYAGNLKISGGSVVVKVSKSEGIECKGDLTISGGEVYSYSSGDDAINCQGEMNVTGGYVYAHSTANDAMDSNGDMILSGGYVFAVTSAGNPEVAIDANTEGGAQLYIKAGATVVAYGGLESGASLSQSCYTMSCTSGGWNSLYGNSSHIAAFKAPSGVSSVVVSAPSLSKGYKGVSVSGTTYCNGIWATSGISGGSESSLSSYSGGNSGGGPGGGGPGGGGRW
ncbi:MAG: carbohydrate-binding domain-containing protein [Bacteroidales bacterium]|nr:carbohydrate-binding domain-containing protein [Bacteroidales bacterium]